MLNAIVTIEFTLRNVCSEEQLKESGLDFEDLVHSRISDEGLLSLCADGTVTVVAIEQA